MFIWYLFYNLNKLIIHGYDINYLFISNYLFLQFYQWILTGQAGLIEVNFN